MSGIGVPGNHVACPTKVRPEIRSTCLNCGLNLYTMRSSLLLLLILAVSIINAQDCSKFYYFQNNKHVEMTISNRKGKETGKNVYNISNVQQAGGTTSATISSEFFNEKGKSINQATNVIKCNGGVLQMDMKMFISGEQQTTATGTSDAAFLEYPVGMKEGDVLNDGTFKMDMKQNGNMNSTMEITVTDRKVEAKESVTTPAGTWECFRISYKSKITTKIAGIGIPIKASVTEWYAPGFGVVKTESNFGKTEITLVQ